MFQDVFGIRDSLIHKFTTSLDLELACRESRSYYGYHVYNSGCMTACILLGSRHYPVGSIGSKLYIARALHCFRCPFARKSPFQHWEMALELSQPLNQAIDALTRESNDMEASFRSSFLHIKMAAKFLVQEDNKEAWERDPEFLKQQTEELVTACKKLIEEERRLKRWSTALAGMKTSDDVHRQLREATGVDAELPDLGEILQKKLSVPDKAAASSYLQDPRYKELTKILGIGEEDDEDEELQVMDTQDEGKSLKCPLTTVLLEDPVMAPCRHTFSRRAIEELLRNKHAGVKCPVPGCNNNFKLNQLKKDEEKALLLKRYTRTQQQRMTQQQEEEEED